MVDVNVNNMGKQYFDDYSDFYPFDKKEYFHEYCEIDPEDYWAYD